MEVREETPESGDILEKNKIRLLSGFVDAKKRS